MSGDRNRYGTRLGELWRADGESFVTLHPPLTELERACRFLLDHCAWPSQQSAFNACWRAAGRAATPSKPTVSNAIKIRPPKPYRPVAETVNGPPPVSQGQPNILGVP